MKKFFFLIAVFFAVCAFFHHQVLGFGAKCAIRWQFGTDLAYERAGWEDGELVFTNLVLLDPSFHVHIERASFRFNWSSFPKKLKGHLSIDAPHFTLIKEKDFPLMKESWFDLTLAVNRGTTEWEGLVHFSLSHSEEKSQVFFEWEDASMIATYQDEKFEAELKNFKASAFKKWFPFGEILDGRFTGRIVMDNNLDPIAANLKIDRLYVASWRTSAPMQELSGRSIGQELMGGNTGLFASIQNGEGTLSYNSDLGAKWELKGIGTAQGAHFPFIWEGRGFFKSRWMESEIRTEDSTCKISGQDVWTFECSQLHSAQLTFLQAGVAISWPEVADWSVLNGVLTGKAVISPTSWNCQFSGKNLDLKKGDFSIVCERINGDLTERGGTVVLADQKYDLNLQGLWNEWIAEGRFEDLHLSMKGGWDGEKFPIRIEKGRYNEVLFSGSGWVDANLDLAFDLDGFWTFPIPTMAQNLAPRLRQSPGIEIVEEGSRIEATPPSSTTQSRQPESQILSHVGDKKKIAFKCPNLSKQGGIWTFDVRGIRDTWDLFRLVGSTDGKEIFNWERSHFLGMPLQINETQVAAIGVNFQLPWKSILSMEPFLQEWGINLDKFPPFEEANVGFKYKQGCIELVATGGSPVFQLEIKQHENHWTLDLRSDLYLQTIIQKDGSAKGNLKWKQGLDVEFEGKIDSNFRAEFSLPWLKVDLAQINDPRIGGYLEGQGHFIYSGAFEADFDLSVSSLTIQSHSMENEGLIHLSYSSNKGALFRGVNLHGPFDCIVDLLEYDAARAHWIFFGAQVHMPCSFLRVYPHLPETLNLEPRESPGIEIVGEGGIPFLKFLDQKKDLNFTADIDFASDFSMFSCKMREGLIPYNGNTYLVENLDLSWDKGQCSASLYYKNHLYRIHSHFNETISGRVLLGDEEVPLAIDWDWGKTLKIHSIDGSFGGIEASFHAEDDETLIGSARINFTALSEFLPLDVAQVFDEIKMGKGYEFKGRLKLGANGPHFHGIVCGKQIELFGFQFRTILGQVDLGYESIRLYDVKISDTAGIMKLDEVLLEGKNNLPWTISIPQLSILELRPSLLQRPGGTVGPISPLVVRELHITDFKGLLDDGSTYTANGNLHFINSYKRGETIFDLPANVLSRIVGLDLELLIPVCGDLKFELKNGYFNLLELTNAYSEGNRSQFFLEMDPPPSMDLDGNLEIYIKMKQFVLLKITESFLISIDGALNDPQFHLRKKRFFGLL